MINHSKIRSALKTISICIFIVSVFFKIKAIILNGGTLIVEDGEEGVDVEPVADAGIQKYSDNMKSNG